MKRLLILTGPQGAGNHVWSKIFAIHPAVFAWSALLDEYWIGHDQEPFADYWREIGHLKEFDWSQKDYYVTSMSVPYMDNGQVTMPDIQSFIAESRRLGIDTLLVVLGRDRNILSHQETRLRGDQTYTRATELYETLSSDYFLSYELLQLYRSQYLKTVSHHLDFPIAWDSPTIDAIITEDANAKYFQSIEHHWIDDLVRKTSSKWR